MHVLIIPSEEYVPEQNLLAGIFQYHQAGILQEAGYKIGVISIRQKFSVFMFIKGFLLKCFGVKTGNATDELSAKKLCKLAFRKLFKPSDFAAEEYIEGVRVYRVEGMYYLPPSDYNNLFGWVKAGMLAFEIYVKINGRPDIIHAHNALYAGILAEKISKKCNIPYIITEHSTAFARNLVKDKRLLKQVNKSFTDASAVFAVSQPFCKLLSRQFKNVQFLYLPNVIDPFLENKEMIIMDSTVNEFVFLNIAELHPKKNQKLLINAFAILLGKIIDVKISLELAGDGIDFSELADLIVEKGLQNSVKMLGSLKREEVFETIAKSNCFVLSSNYETFGVVLIEAMLLGKPVISTRCGGPEGFVNATSGILVEKGNEELLAEAMFLMIRDYSTYNSSDIRNYAIKEFGQKTFISRMNHIYNHYSSI